MSLLFREAAALLTFVTFALLGGRLLVTATFTRSRRVRAIAATGVAACIALVAVLLG